jgi:N-acyl-D-amino-acid deacylase
MSTRVQYDYILRGGWVIDGSGGPPYLADVAVLETLVGDVGRLDGAQAAHVLDVTGHYVVPGFIDTHVHGDLELLADPIHLPALRQGITTYILGQDGSAFSVGNEATLSYMRQYTAGFNGPHRGLELGWRSFDECLSRYDRRCAQNVAMLVPNGNLRLDAMGLDPRQATATELEHMRRLAREALEAGAIGISSGLDYIPSRYADSRELEAICHELAEIGGVYVTHMRAYGRRAAMGMEEVVAIARAASVAAHVSHYNGPADLLLPLADQARSQGVDLTFDTYPYLAGSTILAMAALPPWIQDGGVEPTIARLKDERTRNRLEREWFSAPLFNPLGAMHIAMAADPSYEWAEGMTVTAAAHRAGMSPGHFVCEILLACHLAVGVVAFRPGERTDSDVRSILRHPAHMAGSDGIYCGGFPHPRGWGAFARYLGRHTRELGDYDWAEAVTHLSAHAARRYRLTDRGLIRPGFAADLAVFDPVLVVDRSTYAEGRRLAEGVRHVLVNGVPVLLDGEPTGATPGRALRRG